MAACTNRRHERYAQDTEFALLDVLIGPLQARTFVDVGAEKGAFARFFMQKGLRGTLFEPYARHHKALHALTDGTSSRWYGYAIDREDHQGTLFLSHDEDGAVRDYLHSLQALYEDPRVRHESSMPVVCRSLGSLVAEGILDAHMGVLKIDTEGNDLNVLRGIGALRAEVLICEFFTEGIYTGWEEAHPEGLIDEAVRLGYHHYLVVQRHRGTETVSWQTKRFVPEQWGNLIFLNDIIYHQCREDLDQIGVAPT